MMMVMKLTMMLVEPVHLYWIETSAWPEHNPLGSQPEASIMHGFVKALSCLTVCYRGNNWNAVAIAVDTHLEEVEEEEEGMAGQAVAVAAATVATGMSLVLCLGFLSLPFRSWPMVILRAAALGGSRYYRKKA